MFSMSVAGMIVLLQLDELTDVPLVDMNCVL